MKQFAVYLDLRIPVQIDVEADDKELAVEKVLDMPMEHLFTKAEMSAADIDKSSVRAEPDDEDPFV